MTSLDVRTAFDVARPSTVSRTWTCMESDWFKNCEACIRHGSAAAPGLFGETRPNTFRGKQRENGSPKGWRIWFGGHGDDENRFSCMMWADMYLIFSDDWENEVHGE